MAPVFTEVTEDGIAILTLNRAPVNALVPTFLSDIAETLNTLAADKHVHAVVLTSALKVLSGGFDLKAAQAFTSADEKDIVDHLNADLATMYAFPKPLITAAGGAAIAGGLFFVLTADYTIAVPRAKFGLAEVRVGANFPVGPLEIRRFPRLLSRPSFANRHWPSSATRSKIGRTQRERDGSQRKPRPLWRP